MSEVYGQVTGRKRWIIVIVGAISGVIVALMFTVFGQQPFTPIDLAVGAVIGGLLGLSASLGEKRRARR